MKLLKVELQNLLSLAGTVTIDLEKMTKEGDNIFLIHGVTGAGKTTILDAICLALFDKTPRGATMKTDKFKSPYLTMGRTRGFAKVEFMLNDGIRYRAEWVQYNKNRRQTGGPNLVGQGVLEVERRLLMYDSREGEYLTVVENKKGFNAKIKDLLGFDFDNFTKLVILPQGEFQRFLADEDKRGEILEKLTDTTIFGEISTRIYENEKAARQLYETEAGGVDTLKKMLPAPEVEEETNQTLTETTQDFDVVNKELQVLKDEQKWLADDKKLIEDEAKQQQALEEFQKADAGRLQLGKAAQVVKQQAFDRYCEMEQELSRKGSDLQDKERLLAEMQKKATAAQDKVNQCEEKQKAALEAQQNLLPRLSAGREIEKQISVAEATLKPLEAQMKKDMKTVTEARGELQKTELEYQGLLDRTQALIAQGAIAGGERDDDMAVAAAHVLASEPALEEAECEKLRERNNAIEQWKGASKDCAVAQEKQSKAEAAHDEALAKKANSQTALAESKAELERRQKVLDFTDLASLRAKLVVGEPCPLCGEVVKSLDNLPEVVATAKADLEAAQKQCATAEANERKASNAVVKAETELSNAKQRVQELQEKIAVLATRSGLAPTASLETLAAEGQSIQNNLTLATLRRDFSNLRLSERRERLEGAKAGLAESEKKYNGAKDELDKYKGELASLFPNTTPNQEEQKANTALKAAQDEFQVAKNEQIELNKDLALAQGVKTTLEQDVAQITKSLQEQQEKCSKILQENGFQSLDDMKAAILPESELTKLQNRFTELQENGSRLAGRREQQDKSRPSKLTPDLDQRQQDLQAEYDKLEKILVDCRGKISQWQEIRESISKLESGKIKELKEIADKWSDLASYIGRANGADFKLIAQRYTLDFVLQFANRRLQKLMPNNRYTLIQEYPEKDSDLKNNLLLSVIDHANNDSVRSAKNLSGGESFIVSLALALALSDINTQSMQIRSLFLDEGFGTLDKNCLEQVIAALNNLNAENRQIGIISHVDTLQEAIPQHIEVVAAGNGHSRVCGDPAWCSHVVKEDSATPENAKPKKATSETKKGKRGRPPAASKE